MPRFPWVAAAVWLAGATAATAVSLSAIRVVGDSVTGSNAPPVAASAEPSASPAPPTRRPTPRPSPSRSGAPGGATTPGPAPAASRQPPSPVPAAVIRTFALAGGTATVSCAGPAASLRYASPNPGWSQQIQKPGGEEVEIRWTGAGGESRLKVYCAGGTPSPQVEERGSGD